MEMNRELWEWPCKCTSTTLVSGGPFPVARWIITMFLPRVRVLMWGAFGPPQVLFMAMIYSLKEQTGPDKTIWFGHLNTSLSTMHANIETYGAAYERLRLSISTLVLGSLNMHTWLRERTDIHICLYKFSLEFTSPSMHQEYATSKFTWEVRSLWLLRCSEFFKDWKLGCEAKNSYENLD